MKGIIAQIEGKYAVVLAQDGSFRKIRAKPHMETGIEIDMDQPAGKLQNTRLVMKVTSIAAAALLALGAGYGAYSYAMPYSYVHLDINPSVELTANVYDRIIKAEALNEDGRKLLEGSSLKFSRIETGVSDLLGIAVEKGYLTEDEPQTEGATTGAAVNANTPVNVNTPGGNTDSAEADEQPQVLDNAVLVTVSSNSPRKSGNLKKKIMDVASRELDTDKVESEILVGETSMEQRNEARELGITPGKLALIEDAMEGEPEFQLDDLKKDSVKELLKKLQGKENKRRGNGNTGAQTGAREQGSREQPPDNKTDSPVRLENAAVLKNHGNGRAQAAEQGTQDQKVKAGIAGSAGSPAGNSKSRSLDWINNRLKNETKGQTQNKTRKKYDNPGSESEQTRTGVPGKGQDEGTVNDPTENSSKNAVTDKGEQAKSGIGSSNNKNTNEADRKTAGKNANELKTQRKQLSNDLLDQMEKQLKERNNILNGKNTNADKSNANSGKTDMNSSGKKR